MGFYAYSITVSMLSVPWIYGNLVAYGLFGFTAMLMIVYLRIVWFHIRRKKTFSLQRRILSIYVVFSFIAGTLSLASNTWISVIILSMYCDDICTTNAEKASMTSSICFILTALLVDVVLIWRFLCIYNNQTHVQRSVLAFSLLLLFAEIEVGYFLIKDLSGNLMKKFLHTTLFVAITLCQNMMLTCFNVGRLLLLRYRIRNVLEGNHDKDWTASYACTRLSESNYCR
ncbi:hypothetical protein BDQ17DRAFT_337968 [Cyathus striatus]|nr:hypothetical protein BDQ17DRAFT_337968 [Cyathus striatus]